MKLENICLESILLIILCPLNNKRIEVKLCVEKIRIIKRHFDLKIIFLIIQK
jgi:hypothetical protein